MSRLKTIGNDLQKRLNVIISTDFVLGALITYAGASSGNKFYAGLGAGMLTAGIIATVVTYSKK